MSVIATFTLAAPDSSTLSSASFGVSEGLRMSVEVSVVIRRRATAWITRGSALPVAAPASAGAVVVVAAAAGALLGRGHVLRVQGHALATRTDQRLGARDGARVDPIAPGLGASLLLQREPLAVARPHVLLQVPHQLGRKGEALERRLAESDRALVRLADLVGDAALEQLEGMDPVVSPDEELGERAGLAQHLGDAGGDLLALDADADQACLHGARGAQHVEARAVAEVDLEAEPLGRLDHLDVVVD